MKKIMAALLMILLAPPASALSITLDPLASDITPGSTIYANANISGSGSYTLEIDPVFCESSGSGCAFHGNDTIYAVFSETGTRTAVQSASGIKQVKITLSFAVADSSLYSYKVYAFSEAENASVTGDVRYTAPVPDDEAPTGAGGSGFSSQIKSITVNPNGIKLRVNFESALSNPYVTVTILSNIPVSAPENFVFQYLNITKRNFNNSDIKNATIDFRVEKSRILRNNVTNIYLEHYDGAWSRLRTELIESAPEYNTYRAYAASFSYFAIVGERAKIEQPKAGIGLVPVPVPINESVPEAKSESAPVTAPTALALSQTSRNAGVAAAVILMIIVVLYYLKARKH